MDKNTNKSGGSLNTKTKLHSHIQDLKKMYKQGIFSILKVGFAGALFATQNPLQAQTLDIEPESEYFHGKISMLLSDKHELPEALVSESSEHIVLQLDANLGKTGNLPSLRSLDAQHLLDKQKKSSMSHLFITHIENFEMKLEGIYDFFQKNSLQSLSLSARSQAIVNILFPYDVNLSEGEKNTLLYYFKSYLSFLNKKVTLNSSFYDEDILFFLTYYKQRSQHIGFKLPAEYLNQQFDSMLGTPYVWGISDCSHTLYTGMHQANMRYSQEEGIEYSKMEMSFTSPKTKSFSKKLMDNLVGPIRDIYTAEAGDLIYYESKKKKKAPSHIMYVKGVKYKEGMKYIEIFHNTSSYNLGARNETLTIPEIKRRFPGSYVGRLKIIGE